jgi:DNA-binding protein YbaB
METENQDYDELKEQVISDAKETKQEVDQKQQEALNAISQGGQLEDYETVFLGDLEIEVKAWLPGDVEQTVTEAKTVADSDNAQEVRQSMETMLHALAEMTVDETYSVGFWKKYYAEYGPEGLILAVETIMEPAKEGIENRKDGVESFRPEHK